ncbi:MAG: phosphate uptake regulator PhoU [Fervidicoccaceae archaeon]
MHYIRTVQLTGTSSLIISLPKEWAERSGIAKGSKVEVLVEPDGSLRILPIKEKREIKESVYRVKQKENPALAATEAISAYIAGYDLIVFCSEKSDKAEWMDKFKKIIISKTMDTITIEENEKCITLKVLESRLEHSMEESVGLMFRHIEYMFEDLLLGLERRDESLLRSSAERDDMVDQVYLALTRYISGVLSGKYSMQSSKIRNLAEALHYHHGLKAMERIGDHISNISNNLLFAFKSNCEVHPELSSVIRNAERIVEDAIRNFSKLSQERTVELLRRIDDEINRVSSIKINSNECGFFLISAILSIYRILSYSSDILEIVLDLKALREPSSS